MPCINVAYPLYVTPYEELLAINNNRLISLRDLNLAGIAYIFLIRIITI